MSDSTFFVVTFLLGLVATLFSFTNGFQAIAGGVYSFRGCCQERSRPPMERREGRTTMSVASLLGLCHCFMRDIFVSDHHRIGVLDWSGSSFLRHNVVHDSGHRGQRKTWRTSEKRSESLGLFSLTTCSHVFWEQNYLELV